MKKTQVRKESSKATRVALLEHDELEREESSPTSEEERYKYHFSALKVIAAMLGRSADMGELLDEGEIHAASLLMDTALDEFDELPIRELLRRSTEK